MKKISDKAREKKIINALKCLEEEYGVNLNIKTNKSLLVGSSIISATAVANILHLVPDVYLIIASVVGITALCFGIKKQKEDYNENMFNIAFRSGKMYDMFKMLEMYKSEDKLFHEGIRLSDDNIRYYLMNVVENNAEFLRGKHSKRALKKSNNQLRKEMVEKEKQK